MKRYRIVPWGTTQWQVESQNYYMRTSRWTGKQREEGYTWDWVCPRIFDTEKEAEDAILQWIEEDKASLTSSDLTYQRAKNIPPRIFP